MIISNRTRILVTLEPTEFGCIRLHTNGFEHGRSQSFYISRTGLSLWLDGGLKSSSTFMDNDLCSFLRIDDLRNGRLRFTFCWLSPVFGDALKGRKESFLLPFDRFRKAVGQNRSVRLAAVLETPCDESHVTLSANAHRQVQRIAGRKRLRRAFSKAMRDCFRWPGSSVELCADWRDDFGFRERQGDLPGIVGGLCLSRDEIRGRDGGMYPRCAYSVHT